MTTTRLILFIFFLTTCQLSAQVDVKDLSVEINNGHITFQKAVGNGSSSGNSIDGYLINERPVDSRIDIFLTRPLFMENRGSGQNMVAAMVFLGNGRYQKSGRRSFITLSPKIRTLVSFVAYCVDFAKENPTKTDEFSISTIPPVLTTVMTNIRAYSIANPDSDITCAAQVAIWLAQGEKVSNIESKFKFTKEDLDLAQKLVK